MKTYKEFITELSGGTLARYIAKATGSLRSAAAKHGRNMSQGKIIELGRKSKLKGTTGNYEKMYNREQGIQQATRKLAGKAEEQRLDNIIRSTVDGGAPKKITKPIKEKDPLAWLSKIGKEARERISREKGMKKIRGK